MIDVVIHINLLDRTSFSLLFDVKSYDSKFMDPYTFFTLVEFIRNLRSFFLSGFQIFVFRRSIPFLLRHSHLFCWTRLIHVTLFRAPRGESFGLLIVWDSSNTIKSSVPFLFYFSLVVMSYRYPRSFYSGVFMDDLNCIPPVSVGTVILEDI